MLVGAPGVVIAIIMWFVVREPLKQAAESGNSSSDSSLSFSSVFGMFGHRNAKVAPLTLICAMGGIFVIAALLFAYLTAPEVLAALGLIPWLPQVFSLPWVWAAVSDSSPCRLYQTYWVEKLRH